MNEYIIIIFGASGDLAKRKLLPALYTIVKKYSNDRFYIIGTAIDSITSTEILEQTQKYITSYEDSSWQRFAHKFFYHSIDFKSPNDYQRLKTEIDTYKSRFKLESANTLIYFATTSYLFYDITQQIAEQKIATRSSSNTKPWTRLIYEKPFGHDLTSAHHINNCIAKYFDEDQIYRIDHYLTKELVGNIALVRFTNLFFEPLWNNRYIDNVQIILSESENIGNRGLLYDQFGATKDVLQNHMLELLALIAMETPKTLYGNDIRDERAKVLQKIIAVDFFCGQYDSYTKSTSVPENSTTETFIAAFLRINNTRWAGVPFYLKTGKCLSKKETVIHIKFKSVDCLLESCNMQANVLTIEISPKAGFVLRLNAKKPGEPYELTPVNMEFCHSCIFGNFDEQAYQTLLENVIKGEQSISVRFDEIEYAWQVVNALQQIDHHIYKYPCGSDGPSEIEQFNKKHGIRWLS